MGALAVALIPAHSPQAKGRVERLFQTVQDRLVIDRTHELPIIRQCQILQLARSTAYYQPMPMSAVDLPLMHRIDELHLDHPFAGARMLRDLLRREGPSIGWRHVSTLMTRMGIEAVYRKLPHQPAGSTTSGVSLPPMQRGDHPVEPCLDGRYHFHSDAPRLRVPVCGHGLGQSPGAGVEALQHVDD